MTAFALQLGPLQVGAEVLAHMARQRLTGRLQCGVQSAKAELLFREGRPEGGKTADGSVAKDRTAVVNLVRGVAVTSSGRCTFEPQDVPAAGLGIDTLGEVLLAILQLLPAVQVDTVLSARGAVRLEPTAPFAKLAQTIAQMGGVAIPAPSAPATFGDLVRGGETAKVRAVLALWALGGLKAADWQLTFDAAPPPPPQNPLAQEIAAAFAASAEQDHYAFLGVAKNAPVDAIRKAYFEQAKRWHADRLVGAGIDDNARRQAEELFRRADEAQRLLANPDERKNYDWIIERQAQGLPTDAKTVLEAEGLFRKGETLVRRGQAPAAEPLLRQAVDMNKGEAEFWAYLGYAVYASRGAAAVAEAREHLNKALGMREKLDVAHEFLGRIAHNEGDVATAKKHLTTCLEMNPKNQYAEREMRLLQLRQEQASKEAKGGAAGILGKLFKR